MEDSPYIRWSRAFESETKRAPSTGRTLGTLRYAPVYFPGDVEPDTSVPGFFPYGRGARASMYGGRPWTLRQYAGFSTAEESNAFYRASLAKGQRGLSVAFDLPTHRGYDSDHERARGDVGKAGVAVDSVEDMKRLFHQIDLGAVSVSMTMNGAVLPVLAAYLVAAEEQGVALATLQGTIQNDILKEFLVRNTYIYPPDASMRITTDVISFCSAHMPRFNPISISGYHLQEAGASAELELAYSLANGLEYVKSAVESGLDVDQFAPRLSFFFGVGMDFFLEVSKLRAARILWARLIARRFGAKNPDSLRLRMHCQTSGVSLTAQRPINNTVRTAVEAMAAVLGGTQSLHTNAYDEALALPSDEAASVARDTQLILREETDLTHVVDPLAGCYLVEDLTAQLVAQTESLLSEIEAQGGMVAALARGGPQARIARSAAERQSEMDRGTRRLVGVNCYRDEAEEAQVEVRFVENEAVLKTQVAALESLRRKRDQAAVQHSLERLRQAARDESQNLLAASFECMKMRATVGEVSAALEQIYGRYRGEMALSAGVYGAKMGDDERFRSLTERVALFTERNGRRPRVLVAKLGLDGHDRGAKVVASGFADAGFDVDLGSLFQTPREVALAAVESDVHIIGVSSHAGVHCRLVPELIHELRELDAGHMLLVLGGIIPKGEHEHLMRQGVAHIFEPGVRR